VIDANNCISLSFDFQSFNFLTDPPLLCSQEEEEVRSRSRRRLTQQLIAQRLEHIKLMEETAMNSMDKQEKLRIAEIHRLEDDIKRKKEKEELELKNLAEAQALEVLEFESQKRVLELERELSLNNLKDRGDRAAETHQQRKNLRVEVKLLCLLVWFGSFG